MRQIKITSIRTPAAQDFGYDKLIGQTVWFTGNAYHGFYFMHEGQKYDLMHFNYSIFKEQAAHD